MKIALLQFYSHAPAPDYREMAAALRSWGHTVWLATPTAEGAIAWSDGQSVVATQAGVHGRGRHAPVPGTGWIASRLGQLSLLLRVRRFLLETGWDVIQIVPYAYDALLTIGVPRSTCCVLDVRQAGEVGGGGILGRIRNWKVRVGLRVSVRIFFDHSCFATGAAAARVLGRGWERLGSVHAVGQHPSFLGYRWGEPGEVRPTRDRVRFIYVGSISRVRRLERLLEGTRVLKEQSTLFTLDLIGTDHAGGYYQTMAVALGVGEYVRFHEPVPYDQVAAMVSGYDVAVAYAPREPDWEVQPTLKVLEFRALGMPILATESSPNRAVVTDGVNGVLTADDAVSVAGGMLRFITDRAFLKSCTERARTMRQGRTWADAAAEYDSRVYRHCRELTGRSFRCLLRS
jgi:glycosyltransferase involved in cell wall biosynthesis